MKNVFVTAMLFMFIYAAFRPPEGMRKFPVANLQFEMQTSNMSMSISK
jgi:hypothetical protein